MLGTVTVVLVVVLAGLVFFFLQTRRKDQISAMLEKRRASSKLVSKAEYASGMARMPVALSLSGETVFYENPDMEASLDLSRIDEVEYDDELTTGHQVPAGSRVMRIRSHGTAFDFVLTAADASRWQQVLPSKQIGQPAARVG